MPTRSLDLGGTYQIAADRILSAREESKIIHSAGNIGASGDQVERAVRSTIASRLPPRYRTNHGHIVDYCGRVSRQLDIVIAENLASNSLFESSNGTEFFPYESVYAIGEIKSTYRKSDLQIKHFSEMRRELSASLTRQTNIHHPLLTFMIFCSAGDFAVKDIEEFYRSTPREQLPTFVCFFDLGTIVFMKFGVNGHGQPIPLQYHSASNSGMPLDESHRWCLIKPGDASNRAGANLMFLQLQIVEHLQKSGLAVPNLALYLDLALKWEGGEVFE